MSRIVIVILIYHRHKPIDLIFFIEILMLQLSSQNQWRFKGVWGHRPMFGAGFQDNKMCGGV
jgi:hypothetical protein